MAIANLHNLSMMNSSFRREHQSQQSRHRETDKRESSPVGSQDSSYDSVNFHYEHFLDFGEVEKERVRRIFREWMDNDTGERASTVSSANTSPKAQWLGEIEQERVRVIRARVQLNSQHKGAFDGSKEKQEIKAADQIEQVRDVMIDNQNRGQPDHIRRGTRKLCGRQALLDMVKKAERERQIELQHLLEHRAVSRFVHRNRIQSLLRGRFLRNDRRVEDERLSSVTANELGSLRQRHTVSGLREGFISRLGHFVCDQKASSSHSNTSSFNVETNSDRSEQTHGSNSQDIYSFNEQIKENDDENDKDVLLDGEKYLEDNIIEDIDWQQSKTRIDEWQGQVSEDVVREWKQSASYEFLEGRNGSGQGLDGQWEENYAIELSGQSLDNESGDCYHLHDTPYMFYEQSPRGCEEGSVSGLIDTIQVSENNLAASNQHNTAAPEQLEDVSEIDWQRTGGESYELRDGIGESMDANMRETAPNRWQQTLIGNENRENLHLQEVLELRHDDSDIGETTENWLEVLSDLDAVPAGSEGANYMSDDDNAYSIEIRELLRRRRVSNLLRSGFRESLNQLLQSYIERQNHTTTDWESDESFSAAHSDAESGKDLDQQNEDHNEGHGDVESPRSATHSPAVLPLQYLWDEVSNHNNQQEHEIHHPIGIEMDVINDLKADIVMLHQRMNSMHKMLEECMDMQIELQRSIRQEVSAALNQSAKSPDVYIDNIPKDEPKWENVRKEICCLCLTNKIDPLLDHPEVDLS